MRRVIDDFEQRLNVGVHGHFAGHGRSRFAAYGFVRGFVRRELERAFDKAVRVIVYLPLSGIGRFGVALQACAYIIQVRTVFLVAQLEALLEIFVIAHLVSAVDRHAVVHFNFKDILPLRATLAAAGMRDAGISVWNA